MKKSLVGIGSQVAVVAAVAIAWNVHDLAACELVPVVLEPEAATDFGTYGGQSGATYLAVGNANVGKPASTFPEPPLRLTRNGSRCDIEGGIWIADGFFLAKDQSVLWSYEFSADAASMVAYDVASCREVARITADGLRPQPKSGSFVLVEAGCHGSCELVSQPQLNDRCLPGDR